MSGGSDGENAEAAVSDGRVEPMDEDAERGTRGAGARRPLAGGAGAAGQCLQGEDGVVSMSGENLCLIWCFS